VCIAGTRRIKLNQMLNTLPIYATGCTVEIGNEGQALGIASGAVVRGTHRDVSCQLLMQVAS